MSRGISVILIVFLTGLASAQVVSVRPAPQISMPAHTVDGNSPGVWQGDRLNVYTSTGTPSSMNGPGIFDLSVGAPPIVTSKVHFPMWIESVWRDDDGLTYGWYHHEAPVCGKLNSPEIGALVSSDGGHTFDDLGIVLSSGDGVNCGAQNGFFAGGHGDFSVILDRKREYFYFVFTNYAGPALNQGIAMARMPFPDRANPKGAVRKLHQGQWEQPGVGGAVTPIFPAHVPWERSNADSFWGPAIHWNTAIDRYVVLLNRACCKTNWPQEGIYISFSADLSDPSGWVTPAKILDDSQIGFAPGYYPQVFGVDPGDTDTIAGQTPRLFIKGVSRWELFFDIAADRDPEEEPDPGDPGDGSDGNRGLDQPYSDGETAFR